LLLIAKARSGGKSVVEGFCFEEQGRTVFETAGEIPETMAVALQAVIRRDTRLALETVCRTVGAGKSAPSSDGQIAYVGSEPNPSNAPGYANLAPEGSEEASQSNMAPNLTDTDAYVNRVAEQEIEKAMRRRSPPPPDGG
jgi:hypothetical protein